jgi:sporulation protein YlmC with PRC-barrel domain
MPDDIRTSTLISLNDESLTVADAAEDVRGYTVLDRNGDDIGSVDDLLVDDGERKVRFLQIKSGGFLGLGGKTFHIPVDAVVKIHDDHVHVDQTREHVGSGPAYDPDVVMEGAFEEGGYYHGVYRHYGHSPYWAPGYVYPMYPFFRP